MNRRAFALIAALAIGGSCQAVRDYATYRRVLAHEREFADLRIARYEVRVDLAPAERRAQVRATAVFRNEGREPVGRVRVLLADGVRLRSPRCGGLELEHRTEAVALGGFRATVVEVSGVPPIETGGERAIEFDYGLATPPPGMAARLEPTDGFLLLESLWVPTLRTPLSDAGMERAPLVLEVTLPAPLEPVGLADFELLREEGNRRTYRGATDFPFAPFFAYGEYRRIRNEAGGVAVFVLAPLAERGERFVAEAAGEIAATYERWFGRVERSGTKVVAVRRYGGSWGAPGCVLLDEGGLPHETWQERTTYHLLAHELAHTWWGSSVAMHGKVGYVHEGLANWCSAEAFGLRYGPDAKDREYEGWLVRYARGPGPLRRPLRRLSIFNEGEYERGAYLVGAHFYRALAGAMGEARFLALLRRLHEERASRSADLGDLRALCEREGVREVDDLFRRWVDSTRASDALYREGREKIGSRTAYWRAREPRPSESLRADVEGRLERACAALAEEAAPLSAVDRRGAALQRRLDPLNALPEMQVTVVDARGDLAYHASGLVGNVLGHLDVRGASVYGSIVESKAPAGSIANFDFLNETLRAARENAIAWRRLPDLDLFLVVEGHEWRAME